MPPVKEIALPVGIILFGIFAWSLPEYGTLGRVLDWILGVLVVLNMGTLVIQLRKR